MSSMWQIAKLGLLAIYAAAILSFFIPSMAANSKILIGLSIGLLAIHTFEYVLLKNKLKELEPDGNHFIQTLLFGVAHVNPILGRHKK